VRRGCRVANDIGGAVARRSGGRASTAICDVGLLRRRGAGVVGMDALGRDGAVKGTDGLRAATARGIGCLGEFELRVVEATREPGLHHDGRTAAANRRV
jgi:hypothetical protein